MNYSKISGQFVCKMAMLLAFVFAACSEDNSPMNGAHGGAAEEQGYYALAGRLGDVYPKLLLGDSIGDTSSHGNLMLAPKGASIIVYELDSLTFDTTGRSFVGSVDDDEGHFVFNSLDLSSPYVLIDEYVPSRDTCRYVTALLPLEDRCFEYTIKEKQLRAIVDLRKNEKISVNSLTSAKVPLLQGYLAEGMTFAEANQMAERKILEDLGIFEDLGSFEEMFDDDSELSYVNKLVQYTEASVRDGLEWGDVVDNYVSPQKFVGRTQIEKYFQNSKKMIDYKIGFLAKIDGLGQCTEARENDVGEIKVPYRENFVNVVCRSKKWTMGFKPVEYTKGLLVDNRDSKSYKTVTYNWGDVVQTWMAEDLVYADSAHPACDGYGDENICVENGGRYEWLDAMDIELEDVNIYWIRRQGGDTISYQECLKVLDSIGVFGFSDSTIWDTHDGTCTDGSWDYDYTNPEMRSNLNAHQGICPDGWRIPTTNDWRTLLQNLGEQYGVDYVKVVPVLYDEVATGFGLSSSADVLGDFYNFFAVADEHLSRVNFFQGYSNGYGFGFNTPTEYQYNENAVDRAPLNGVNVRCIKN